MFRKFLESKISRRFSRISMPYKINLSMTYDCNLECKTCFIWQNPKKKEISTEEWQGFFRKTGNDLHWLSVSGGEPFLRKDIPDLFRNMENRKLSIVSMNTNGYMPDRIHDDVEEILTTLLPKKIKFFIAVSLLGYEETHNLLTGKDSYSKASETYELLRDLKEKYSNLQLVRGLLINRENLHDVKGLTDDMNSKKIPFTLIIAQESEYYKNLGKGVAFSPEERDKLIEILGEIKIPLYGKEDMIRRLFRRFAIRNLRGEGQPLPCYSSWSSLRIDPYGNVYPCIIRNDSLGNLRENNMDLRKTLMRSSIKKLQEGIKQGKCECWTPCEAYQTIIQNFPFT